MERESFDRLLLQHLPAAQRFAVRLTGDVHQAEDLLHDAIVRAVKGCESFESRSRFTTWFFQIIVNGFHDRLRARGEATELDAGPIEDLRALDPASDLNEQELASLIANRVSALPPRQREVLVLVTYQNLSIADAAQILSISATNVRANLSYARDRLKKELANFL